ncbi:AvrD family protein [Streptomyces mirabilis]|uniref:AvrD family protein n=1 Tax=Streptomyces mirabilis TaxID=68239 RepID=UPI003692F60A
MYKGIDAVLGAASGRFFGDGHRQVSHAVRDIVVGRDEDGHGWISASAGVHYPSNWSVKTSDHELRPHLSTIDAVVLAACLAECYLAHHRSLSEAQRRRAWLRSIQIKAGATPQEELAGFAIHAQVLGLQSSVTALGGHATTMDCGIGPMKVRCEIEHEPGSVNDAAAVYADLDEVLGQGGARYYGGGYRLTRRDIEDLRLQPDDVTAVATIAISEPSPAECGLEADYRPSMSGIDGIVVAGQMTQALLYQLDGVARGATGTLWMRRVAFQSATPHQPVLNPFLARMAATKNQVIERAGSRWRAVDLKTQMLGASGEFSVAHALPN